MFGVPMRIGINGTITGTQIAYSVICKRKLWLYSHRIKMEEFSERVEYAKKLHIINYPRKVKEICIPEAGIAVDFSERDNSIHEIKMTKAMENAHIYQLAYYLKMFKNIGRKLTYGILHYPLIKQTKKILWDKKLEKSLEITIKDIENITSQKNLQNCLKNILCV